jgi:hypothetical protein
MAINSYSQPSEWRLFHFSKNPSRLSEGDHDEAVARKWGVKPGMSLLNEKRAVGFPHHAHAYASTRGSAPALSTPVFASMRMAPLDARDQGGATRNL